MGVPYNIQILNHNYNPRNILYALTKQISAHKVNIFIKLWDDGSDLFVRDQLLDIKSKFTHDYISWNLEPDNLGRAAMRQKMLKCATEGWMISIDSDMEPDADFIDKMIKSLVDPDTVYTGCHYYHKYAPEDQYILHWNYGLQREVPAQKRNPYSHFSTGIYAIHSRIIKKLNFDVDITGYGHEDTLFGLQLQQKGIPVRRISLKAVHQGLKTNHHFIDKQLEAVHNLKVLMSKHPDYQNRLIKWTNLINKIPLIRKWIRRESVQQYCRKKLQQNSKNLFYLDLLKLSMYLRLLNK